ncbi:helix-turn-helix domain-containing protein [Streptomyces sp. NPDC050704]|uniref:PucR family transcriptional regulator n=1 Tax=Streptomyces sp. NPDC050704 TaxID=3157219 RepID=UPI0034465DFE
MRALPQQPSVPSSRAGRRRSLVDAEALDVLHRAARELLGDLSALTDRLMAALREEEPTYRALLREDAEASRQEAYRSLEHSVGSLLGSRTTRDTARHCSRNIAAAWAERGRPLEALLHAFRLGGSLVWQGLLAATARRAPEDVRLLVHVAGDVWAFVDEHCAIAADTYREMRRREAWRRENRLRLMTAALLAGTTRIAELPEVAAALSLPQQDHYAVVGVTAGTALAHSRAAPAPASLGMRLLWHRGDAVEYAIVAVGDTGPERLAEEFGGQPGRRVGISTTVEGLAAVGEARRQAEMALRICPDTGGTVALRDHLASALLVTAPELGNSLADQVLGPLLDLEPSDRDVLLDTLAVWLECDGSAQRASERLYCHRNTVLNRLRRCEQLTGRSLARPTDLVDVSLALSARRLLRRR